MLKLKWLKCFNYLIWSIDEQLFVALFEGFLNSINTFCNISHNFTFSRDGNYTSNCVYIKDYIERLQGAIDFQTHKKDERGLKLENTF